MDLSDVERGRYREDGFLLFPGLLSAEEVAVLERAREALASADGPHVKRERADGPPKIVYAPHALAEPFGLLARLPRILRVVEALLDDRAYVYQSRINLKLPFTGDAWSWHQDFTAWHRGDGMPTPRAVMVAVFLHACNAANGPLLVIPASHTDDVDAVLARERDVEGYATERVTTETIRDLAERTGIVDLSAPAGSVAFIHPTLLHGSAPNLTPWPRSICYFNFNAVSNRPPEGKRPWFMNNPDARPLEPVDDDALLAGAATA